MSDLADDVIELAAVVGLAPGLCPEPATGTLREMAWHKSAWTPSEDAFLREAFFADRDVREIAGILERPLHGVRARICLLGLRRNSTRPWLPEEDNELLARYGPDPAASIARDLGRSVFAVYVRAQLLGCTQGCSADWDSWEDAQLRAGYAAGISVAQIAALVGRPLLGARSRASALGLRHPAQPAGWSDAEVDRALELCEEGHQYRAIIEMLVAEGFPRRTKNGFGQHVRILGYGRGWGRPWLDDEEELLRRAYATGESLTPLRSRLGRSACSIRWKAKELGLQGTHARPDGFRQGPNWRPEEEEYLRKHYGKVPTRELAKHLGRPRGGVLVRAWVLGLKHGYWRPYTADELRAFQIAYRNGLAIADLAIALDRHPMTVSKYATDKLCLHFGRRRRVKPAPALQEILDLEEEAAAA